MVHDLDVVGRLGAIGLGIMLTYIGGRMLIAPHSLGRDSILYRYVAYRLGLFSKTTADTGQLSCRQIRGYGISLIALAVVSIAVGSS